MVKTYVVTLTTGTPVQLSSVLTGGEKDAQRACIWMQPRGTNTAPIYIGSSASMSSTVYGIRLETPVAGIPQAPFNPGEFIVASGFGAKSPVKMADLWVLGITGDFLQLLVLHY